MRVNPRNSASIGAIVLALALFGVGLALGKATRRVAAKNDALQQTVADAKQTVHDILKFDRYAAAKERRNA